MSKIDEAYGLFRDLQRQYPHWPTTFSLCECGRAAGRGSGSCNICIAEKLVELVGEELTSEAAAAIADVSTAWYNIYEKLKNEHTQD